MNTSVQCFTRQLFDRSSIEDIEPHQVQEIVHKYPYFIPARFLLDRVELRENSEERTNNALYFNNHLWYDYLLTARELSDESEDSLLPDAPPGEELAVTQVAVTEKQVESAPISVAVAEPGDISFEPYHTIDYFASQGIKLAPADLSKDKFGQQLKSFTEWLKSMKRLPAAEASPVPDVTAQQTVVKAAEHSIEEREVLTEAMAEVWAKQGNKEK